MTLLRELFYADPDTRAVADDMKYSSSHDSSVMKRDDTRKTRLTLSQINQLRKSSDMHILEQEAEIEFVQKMYKNPDESAAGGAAPALGA